MTTIDRILRRAVSAVVVLPLCVLAACGGDSAPAQAPDEETETSSALATGREPLLSATALEAMLGSGNPPLVVEAGSAKAFAQGRIPGAVLAERPGYYDQDHAVSGMIAPREQVEALLSRLGVSPSDRVVLYDRGSGTDAARLWWVLRTYGHENLAILDGGLTAWKTAGFPLDGPAEVSAVSAESEYRFDNPGNPRLRATADEVKTAISDENIVIVDARSAGEYDGSVQRPGAGRAGHIPGAVHLNYQDSLSKQDGAQKEGAKKDSAKNQFRSVEELREMFEARGVTPDKKIIVYCQSGARSSHTTFVLQQVLGYPNVTNFDGSWLEWSNDESLPVAAKQ